MTGPDAQALAGLHAQAFQMPAPWSAQDFDGFLRDPACQLEWRGNPDGQLAGFALFRLIAGEAELLTLAVAPHMQRKGVGGAVLGAGLDKLTGRAECCFLEVAQTNTAARGLYARMGFRQVGARRGYYRLPNTGTAVDALILRRDLASH
ncbi:GNAT family N-acetyltransferase [Roseinatronobacter alkalisoli]|uniref:GNAT family N-acetyltransferase n=1 Tax=Roseinatronobacter alkalisoli TaxID=3028235 RepID=A0ABT5T5H4_9RHOB|nr:GNAT family N-acetyltransferase [Roseinatronobacter sp. HJB301]MDD7970363.1 GNAT family N-acetyltransferase [Roseinatronobacter sp. HJB301]